MAPNSPYSKRGNQDSAPLDQQEQTAPPSTTEAGVDSPKPKALEPEKLADAEQQAAGGGTQADQESSSFYNPTPRGHPNQVGRGYRPSRDGLRAAANKRSWLMNNRKKLIIFGGGGTLILLPIIFFLALLLPSLKLPQLAAEIEGYRLARLSRTFYKQASILTADRAALDAGAEGSTADLLGKTPLGKSLNTFRPVKVINNMKANNVLGFDYGKGVAGSQKLNAVILNGEKIAVPDYKYSLKPSDLVDNYKERIRFSAQITAGVNQALDGSNYLVRTSVSKQLLNSYGISLQWWEKQGSEYKNLSQQEADRLALRQAEKQINVPDSEELKTSQLNDAAKAARDAQASCLASNPCTDQEIATNGLAPTVTSAIEKGTTITTAQQILGIVNPTYAVMFPVCIAYDASADTSKQYLNSQNVAAMKTFFAVASASDQQKSGGTTAGAVGAFNRRIGNIGDSYISQISRGDKTVDTSADVSPQAGRTGEFTVFNGLFSALSVPYAGTAANLIAGHVCPVATDLKVAVGLAAVNAGLSIVTLGGADAAEAGAEGAAQGAVKIITSKIASLVTDSAGRAVIKNTAKDYAAGAIKTGAATEGLTYLSRMLVLSEIGAFTSGMDSQDFANQADMGAVAYGNQMNQQATYGRPLTPSETSGVEKEDLAYQNNQNQNQSTFTRNFALSNPYSPVGKIAIAMSGWKLSSVASIFTNLPRTIASIFSPATALFGHAAAASNVNSDYHMVQFGWSTAEENLIDNDPSYDPLVNAQILNDPSNYSKVYGQNGIADTYGDCFTNDIGTMLTNGNINRDSNGDVQDSGLCSPDNLSYKNTSDPNAADSDSQSSHKYDLVFRWRLDQSYQSTLRELQGIQDPSASTASSTSSTTSSGGSTGSAQQLAQQILQASQAGKINFAVVNPANSQDDSTAEDNIRDIAQGQSAHTSTSCDNGGVKAPNSTVNLSPTLLQFVLDLSSSTSFTINELAGGCHDESNSNHYNGTAVDFGCPFDPTDANQIGSKYNISDGTGETCSSGAGHYHYSIGGN